jgi:hypothetical protein
MEGRVSEDGIINNLFKGENYENCTTITNEPD